MPANVTVAENGLRGANSEGEAKRKTDKYAALGKQAPVQWLGRFGLRGRRFFRHIVSPVAEFGIETGADKPKMERARGSLV
jgi:hypothetical protein